MDFTVTASIHERDDVYSFDAVMSLTDPIDVSRYPGQRFIFGPHFSVFPNEAQLDIIKSSKTVYNLLSDWVIDLWASFPCCHGLRMVALPFGVDTDRFTEIKPMKERKKIMIYFKNRALSDLHAVEDFMKDKNVGEYSVFSYDQRYHEDNYLALLRDCWYIVWVGRHESQGFALQEALSCNVPLLVWSVVSMCQEYGQNYPPYRATTIPYWDERCGEFFTDASGLAPTYEKFMTRLENYRPREFVLENLSTDVCEERFIRAITKI